jgi:protein SCO1/2
VYDIYKDSSEVLFASHTIDPENDSITLLKAYSNQLGIDSKKWYFLHGEREYMHNLAENGYFSQAYQDQNVPGGYAHSGGFILVDKRKHIRGVYDGTDSDDVNRLIKEIAILLNEKLE